MRTRAQNAGWAPSGVSAWTGRWSEVEGTLNASCASTSPITTSIGPIERPDCILPLIGQTDHDCENMNEWRSRDARSSADSSTNMEAPRDGVFVPDGLGAVRSRDRLGGLIHEYYCAQRDTG